jgi:hypothetical protein|tara:strand:+ start:1343 stop:1783 length:441 start_codon:yes stop_codon:yes gene_type:complete
MVSVIKFIQEHALFHSEMAYNCKRKSFNLDSYEKTNQGIYFILDKEDILKVGKADGQTGLKGRIATYRNSLVENFKRGDSTVVLWNRVMTGSLSDRVLSIYLLPLEPEKKLFHGVEVELSIARSLELELSKLAKQQGHSLKLSGQN